MWIYCSSSGSEGCQTFSDPKDINLQYIIWPLFTFISLEPDHAWHTYLKSLGSILLRSIPFKNFNLSMTNFHIFTILITVGSILKCLFCMTEQRVEHWISGAVAGKKIIRFQMHRIILDISLAQQEDSTWQKAWTVSKSSSKVKIQTSQI